MSDVQQLYRLQEIDSEIQEKKKRLGDVLNAQRETDELIAARQRAQKAASELASWRTQLTDMNLELQSLTNKAKRSEDRLYSGKVGNPKELTDLQNEIDSLGRRRGGMEDDILEAMIMIEEAEAEKKAADAALAESKSAWEESQAHLKEEQVELALRLRDLADLRQEQLPLISAGALKDYAAISKRRGSTAVVFLRGNICQGCRLNVSAQTVKEVQQGKLLFCDQCGRILTLSK